MIKKLSMKKFNKALFLPLLLAVLVGGAITYAVGPTTVSLGTADNFAVLAGSTITNTGSTVIAGDLGLSPGTSITGFPPGIVNGAQHITDTNAAQAQIDLVTAYNDASGRTPFTTVSGDLGGQTLVPGVYRSTSSLAITGTLTLDAQNDPNAVFIFKFQIATHSFNFRTTAENSSEQVLQQKRFQ